MSEAWEDAFEDYVGTLSYACGEQELNAMRHGFHAAWERCQNSCKQLDTSSLTDRQREIFEFIERRITEQGMPPTMREIGAWFGIRSTNGIACHLDALQKKGFITRDRNSSRGIYLKGIAHGTR